MSNLWEYESKTLGGRRRGFLKAAQTTGFHKLIRDSLRSRGMDPDVIEGLTAPPSVTKPIERDTIKEVVPPTAVGSTQRALQTRPRSTFIPPEERPSEKRKLSGGLLKAVGEVAGQAASDVLSILDVVDIPRREVGKPVARVILEPLAMTADLLNALSPANIPGIPSIRGVTRPPLTGGEIRGGTSVEILSYITDPLNVAFFAGPAIKAAKAATLGVRLGLKDAQALRKVTPLARRLMVEEAGGRAPEELVISFRGTGPSGRGLGVATEGKGLYVTKDRDIARFFSEDMPGGGIEKVRHTPPRNPLVVQDEPLYLLRDEPGIFQPPSKGDSVWTQINKIAARRAGHTSEAGTDATRDLAGKFISEEVRNRGYDAIQIRGGGGSWDVLLDPALYAAERGGFPARFAGKSRILRGGPPPGTRLTKSVPVRESQEIKDFRIKLSGNGRKPPPPPPPRLPGEPGGLLPGDQAPSMSLWRTIESGLFLSLRSNDLMRRTAEMVGDAPGIKLFMKAITGPAALARVLPEIRAGVVYRRLQGIMEAQLGQRLVGQEEAFYGAFKVGRDTSKVIVGGKEVAFGDFATDVLMGTRIGAPRGRYPVTAAQREWVTTQKSLMDDIARQYEHVSGEELRLLGDDYWPRFVQGDDGRVTVKGRIGAKQSPVKDRKFGEMEDAISRGVAYASPTETVQLYGRAMQKMIRDKMLIKVIKEDKLGRPVMQQLTREVKALKVQIKGINTNTVDGLNEVATLRNKMHNLQAIVASKRRSLIPAKQVLGPGFGKQMLEPASAKVIQDIIGPGMGGKVGKGLRGATWVASVPRFVVTGMMDVGQFFIQGATLLATDPVSWSRAVGHSLISLYSPGHWSKFLKTSPEAIEAARFGIGRGGIEFLEITKRSAALGKLPGAKAVAAVFGAAPRSFETFIEGSRIFNFAALAKLQRSGVGKAPVGILPTTGRAAAGLPAEQLEGELFRLAGYVKTKLGTTDLMGLGLATTQRQVESAFLLYSPRYTRSVFGMLGWAVSNGIPARDAQRALGTMLFGGLSAFYGFARAAGLDHDEALKRINPMSGGKFLSLPMGGNEYGFGSAYRATLGFMGSLLRENSWDFDSWEEAAFDNPLANYLRSRTAPTTGTLLDFIEGEDFMGKEVDLNTFIDDPGRLLDYATGKFLPLNLEALFEARGPLEQRILAGLTETVGGRAFPRSAFSLFEDAQESVFQEKKALGEKPYVDFDNYEALAEENAPAVAVIATDPRVQNAQERLEHESRYRVKTKEGIGFEKLEDTRVAQEKLQLEDDAALAADEMASSVWKDNYRGRQMEFFARRDQIVNDFGLKFGKDKAGVNAAIDAYFGINGEDFKNLMTGGVDWDRFFAARDATLEGLSSTNLQLLKNSLRRYDTPTVTAFRKAQSDLDEYWAIEDLVWSRLRENEEFNPYLNLNDYLLNKMQSLADSGVPLEEVSRTLSRLDIVNKVTSMVSKLRNRYRLTHPDADALLGKWYGLSPVRPTKTSLPGRG